MFSKQILIVRKNERTKSAKYSLEVFASQAGVLTELQLSLVKKSTKNAVTHFTLATSLEESLF